MEVMRVTVLHIRMMLIWQVLAVVAAAAVQQWVPVFTLTAVVLLSVAVLLKIVLRLVVTLATVVTRDLLIFPVPEAAAVAIRLRHQQALLRDHAARRWACQTAPWESGRREPSALVPRGAQGRGSSRQWGMAPSCGIVLTAQ